MLVHKASSDGIASVRLFPSVYTMRQIILVVVQ